MGDSDANAAVTDTERTAREIERVARDYWRMRERSFGPRLRGNMEPNASDKMGGQWASCVRRAEAVLARTRSRSDGALERRAQTEETSLG